MGRERRELRRVDESLVRRRWKVSGAIAVDERSMVCEVL